MNELYITLEEMILRSNIPIGKKMKMINSLSEIKYQLLIKEKIINEEIIFELKYLAVYKIGDIQDFFIYIKAIGILNKKIKEKQIAFYKEI